MGYPVVTPRDKLCRLVDFAAHAATRAIIVDIDLTSRDPMPHPAPRGDVRLHPSGERTIFVRR